MLTREAGHRVRRIQSDAFPVLSVCLSLSPLPRDLASVRPRLKDLLDLIRAAADPERLGHEAAMSVRADVERVLELEDRIHADVGHGVAVFACHGLGPFEYLSLPRGLPDRASLDGRAQTGPLDAFLERSHRCVAVVVERDRSSIFEFHQGELEVHREVRDGRIRKRNYGGRAGLDEYTVTRHAREEALRHHRRTVRAVGQLFSPRGSARRTRSSRAFPRASFSPRPPAELLFVGGHREGIDAFVDLLPTNLRHRLAGTFVVDPGTLTPAIVLHRCAALEDAYEARDERQMVARLMSAAGEGRGAVLGLAGALRAANLRAAELLVVGDGASGPGVRCSGCGWVAEVASRCAVCGDPVRPVPDIVEAAAARTVEFGGAVRHVHVDRAMLGHRVGTFLRFPLR